MQTKPTLKLDWCSHKAAKFACKNWHYSKTIPANRSNYIGVWENSKFIGCVIFGLGASPSLGTRYNLKNTDVCELTRVALKSHITPVSKIIKICIGFIKKHNTRLKLIVSFADTFHNHHGGIYQAGNWIYNGMTSSSKILKLPNGDLADVRRFNGHGHNKKIPIPKGTKQIKTPGKHRYLMPLTKEMRKTILPLSKPYPKRTPNSVDSPVQGGEGGANPTCALQSSH